MFAHCFCFPWTQAIAAASQRKVHGRPGAPLCPSCLLLSVLRLLRLLPPCRNALLTSDCRPATFDLPGSQF